MTIHTGHPFADADGDRDPTRRLRGRLSGRVTLWTTGESAEDPARAGLTISSVMVAGGDPGHVLGLVDPDSDLGETLDVGAQVVITPLDWRHRLLADAFAGVTPAPGGPWRLASWRGDGHPPVLEGCDAYAIARVEAREQVGWSALVRARLEEVCLDRPAGQDDDGSPLMHHRGRYRRLASPGGT